jgi:hypothetical protein
VVVVVREVSLPESRPRSVSAMRVASALRRNNVYDVPRCRAGVSRPRASAFMRAIAAGSPARTTRLLVRVDGDRDLGRSCPGAFGRPLVSGTTRCSVCAMSIAEGVLHAQNLHVERRAGRSTR